MEKPDNGSVWELGKHYFNELFTTRIDIMELIKI